MQVFESFILALFLILQIVVFLSVIRAIKSMRSTFQSPYELLKMSPEFAPNAPTELGTSFYALSSDSTNQNFTALKDTINRYLEKNNNAVVDFHILKDIIDRTIDTVENGISSRLATPLYIGLVASMFGIIFGLWNIETINLNFNSILPFLNSIKMAMSVSVSGLIFTLILTVFIFRKNKTLLDEDRNRFFSFLQTELLPRISKSSTVEIAKLNTRLDEFSRSSVQLVYDLKSIVDQTALAFLREQELLEKLNELDIQKVSKINVNIFSKLEQMMTSFEAFPVYYQELNDSLGKTAELNRNLTKLLEQKDFLPRVLDKVMHIIENTQTSTDFFNENIQSFQRYSGAMQNAVSIADDKMQQAIEQLTNSITAQLNAYHNAAASYQEKIDVAFQNAIETYTKAADTQIDRMAIAFEKGMPKWEMIDQMNKGFHLLNKAILSQTEELKKNKQREGEQPKEEVNSNKVSQKKWWKVEVNIGLVLLIFIIALIVKYII